MNIFYRDGPDESARLLARFCEPLNVPTSVNTTGNTAYVKFTSDQTVTASGFQLQWKEEARGMR